MDKEIIFDLDGTIINSEQFMDNVNSELVNRLSKGKEIYNRDLIKPRIAGKTSLEGAEIIVNRYGLDISPEEIFK